MIIMVVLHPGRLVIVPVMRLVRGLMMVSLPAGCFVMTGGVTGVVTVAQPVVATIPCSSPQRNGQQSCPNECQTESFHRSLSCRHP